LNAFPGTNLTVLLLLILIFSPVFGLTPVRAFRVAILKVPKPTTLPAFGLLKTCFDSLDYGVDGAFRLSVASLFPERFWDGCNKFCFRLKCFLVGFHTFKQAWTFAIADSRWEAHWVSTLGVSPPPSGA
jgi:hypothetical protein